MGYVEKPPIQEFILRYMKPPPSTSLKHYGTPRHSGRYPFGSGKRPYQHVDNSGRSDTIVKDAIESGLVKKEINREKQQRHCKDDPNYIPGRSYIDGTVDMARELVETLSGTGSPLMRDDGVWLRKERVTASETVGANIDPDTGNEIRTNKLMITYSKTGTHIMPGKEEKK